ncbi:response regulator [Candidatus Saccharibacteria bacterium]|nr:response regulator [Candidatus Saccharibacteria bacterium]
MSKITRIAVIEDDPIISQMYRTKLETEGFDVQVATDGKSGVKLVKDYTPHVVLLDLKMPEMNGDEALIEIRKDKIGKNIPVIILTNTSKEEAPASLDDLNVADYIVKAELTPSQVVEVIKNVIA